MMVYLNVDILLAFCVCIYAVGSWPSSYGWQKNRFRVTRKSNGIELCAVDPPSMVFDVSQLNVSLVNDGCVPPEALCAWKCIKDLNCVSYNWRNDVKLCELFYYCPTSCAIVNFCSFYQSADNLGICSETGLHPGRYLVQQNMNGSDFFLWRTWREYACGFGDPTDNYWIGNDKLYKLTAIIGNCSLELNMLSTNGLWYTEIYSSVTVSGEADGYRIQVNGPYGNASDGLSNQNGKMFSTLDRDNDATVSQNCADLLRVGWWYGSNSNAVNGTLKCGTTNLNCNSTYFLYYGIIPKQLSRSSIWLDCVG